VITTRAWVLHRGPAGERVRGTLQLEDFALADLGPDEVLAEPLFGSWEGNLEHAIARDPVDICALRNEDKVVIGNAGVIRILAVGANVTTRKEGDLAIMGGASYRGADSFGYARRIFAYDMPGTVGCLAKRIKMLASETLLIPANSRLSLEQWAAFGVRYVTAWSNWKAAYACWRSQLDVEDMPRPYVWGWGGGTAFAEVCLAHHFGADAAMIASSPERLAQIAEHGVRAVDRRPFADLQFDAARYADDAAYRKHYDRVERTFLMTVGKLTGGLGISILVDNIGAPLFRASSKALARMGVLTTCGWKHGMSLTFERGAACISRHLFVHTHYSRQRDLEAAVAFAEETGWAPTHLGKTYAFEDIPALAEDYAAGKVTSYFPIYQVNAV
jgi:NADPH:quinone reductase-like Zn-dependent oxidoreductase